MRPDRIANRNWPGQGDKRYGRGPAAAFADSMAVSVFIAVGMAMSTVVLMVMRPLVVVVVRIFLAMSAGACMAVFMVITSLCVGRSAAVMLVGHWGTRAGLVPILGNVCLRHGGIRP